MTPTTLYSDKKLFVSFYKNAFSRLKGVAMLYGIIMFIVFPMFYFIAVGEAMDRIAAGKRYYGFSGNPEMYPAVAAVFFFAVVTGAIISLIAISNSFMHSKKAVDVFHALPVKRPAMLLANFAAVSSWMIILEAVCYLVVGVTSAFTVPIPTIPLIAEFLRVVVLTLTITAMASFCSVCCNTVLDSAIFTAAFNAIVPAYTFLVYALFSTFIEGFASRRIVMVNSVWFSPVGMLYQTFFAEDLPFAVLHGIIYLAFTVALMALSCRQYVKRKSEMAQSNNINGAIYRFIILAASIGGGAFFGFVISEMFGWGSYNREIGPVTLMSCLFTAVIYLIFSTVTSRKVNPGKKGFMWLGAGLALTAALFISINTGFFGMESYVPNLNDIQSVKIYYAGDYDRVTYYLREPDGTYRYRYGNNEAVVFEDIDEIELIRNMHETIVENLDGVTENTPWDYHSVEVEYTLNNGRRVMRDYRTQVPPEVVRAFMQIDDLESFKRQVAPVLMAPASDLDYFEIKDGFGQNQQLMELSDSEKEMLYNAIAQDTLNRTSQMKKQQSEVALAKISLRYNEIITDENGIVLSENSAPIAVTLEQFAYAYEKAENRVELYQNVCFEVTSDCINTIKALNQLGYEHYTSVQVPENLKAVVSIGSAPYYDTRSANFWDTGKSFDDYSFADHINWAEHKLLTTDMGEIAQIADGCTSTVYSPAVGDKPVFSVIFADANADLGRVYETEPECICYYLPYDEAPQFVKDYFDGQYDYYGYSK